MCVSYTNDLSVELGVQTDLRGYGLAQRTVGPSRLSIR